MDARTSKLIPGKILVKKRFVYLALPLSLTVATPSFASSSSPLKIPLVAGAWEANGNASFLAKEALPNGILQVTSESERGYVALKDGHRISKGSWKGSFARGMVILLQP